MPGARYVLAAVLLLALPVSGRAGDPDPGDAVLGEAQVFLTPEAALRELFEDPATVDTLRAVLTAEERTVIASTLGTEAPSESVTVYRLRGADGGALGFAMIAEEVGKYRPITFMVGTTPERSVRNVEVLVYRESRGGEVRRSRFLRQYRGKGTGDAIRTNRDILNIAGATLSVNALNHGVKRVLLTLELLAARKIL